MTTQDTEELFDFIDEKFQASQTGQTGQTSQTSQTSQISRSRRSARVASKVKKSVPSSVPRSKQQQKQTCTGSSSIKKSNNDAKKRKLNLSSGSSGCASKAVEQVLDYDSDGSVFCDPIEADTDADIFVALPELPELPLQDNTQNSEITSVLSTWLQSVNDQLKKNIRMHVAVAVEKMKEEVLEVMDENTPTSPTPTDVHTDSQDTAAIVKSVDYQSKQIDDLMSENRGLQNRCRILEGRITRSERVVEELKEDLLMQQARSMRENVKFCNIPEVGNEREDCQDTIRTFLRDEMRIADSELEKIKFERIHRVGRRFHNHNRTIVGKVNPEGKAIIFKHTKNLDRAKNYRVADQLPRELEERKKRLIPDYKEAKQDQKTVKWSVDKLVIDGQVKTIQKGHREECQP